jgi:hypothetical protein
VMPPAARARNRRSRAGRFGSIGLHTHSSPSARGNGLCDRTSLRSGGQSGRALSPFSSSTSGVLPISPPDRLV